MMNHAFGLQEGRIRIRQQNQLSIVEKTDEAYHDLLESIQQETQGKDECWKKIVVNDLAETYGIRAEKNRSHLIYRLQTHPNLISRLEAESGGKKLALQMQPYAFRWVPAETKRSLGFSAYAHKYIDDAQAAFLERKMEGADLEVEDMYHVFSQLYLKKAAERWIRLDPMSISVRCMQPIENTIAVLQAFVDRRLLFVGDYDVQKRVKRIHAIACRLLLSEDAALAARLEREAKDPAFLRDAVERTEAPEEAGPRKRSKEEIMAALHAPQAQPLLTEQAEHEIIETILETHEQPQQVCFVGVDDCDMEEAPHAPSPLDKRHFSVKMVGRQLTEVLEHYLGIWEREYELNASAKREAERGIERLKAENQGLKEQLQACQEAIRDISEKNVKLQVECTTYKEIVDKLSGNVSGKQ